jgi:hypothetical protein
MLAATAATAAATAAAVSALSPAAPSRQTPTAAITAPVCLIAPPSQLLLMLAIARSSEPVLCGPRRAARMWPVESITNVVGRPVR